MFNPHLIFNKLIALVLIGVGAFIVWMESDGTFLIFALMLGVPLFFAKENWTTIEVVKIVEDEKEDLLSSAAKTSNDVEEEACIVG